MDDKSPDKPNRICINLNSDDSDTDENASPNKDASKSDSPASSLSHSPLSENGNRNNADFVSPISLDHDYDIASNDSESSKSSNSNSNAEDSERASAASVLEVVLTTSENAGTSQPSCSFSSNSDHQNEASTSYSNDPMDECQPGTSFQNLHYDQSVVRRLVSSFNELWPDFDVLDEVVQAFNTVNHEVSLIDLAVRPPIPGLSRSGPGNVEKREAQIRLILRELNGPCPEEIDSSRIPSRQHPAVSRPNQTPQQPQGPGILRMQNPMLIGLLTGLGDTLRQGQADFEQNRNQVTENRGVPSQASQAQPNQDDRHLSASGSMCRQSPTTSRSQSDQRQTLPPPHQPNHKANPVPINVQYLKACRMSQRPNSTIRFPESSRRPNPIRFRRPCVEKRSPCDQKGRGQRSLFSQSGIGRNYVPIYVPRQSIAQSNGQQQPTDQGADTIRNRILERLQSSDIPASDLEGMRRLVRNNSSWQMIERISYIYHKLSVHRALVRDLTNYVLGEFSTGMERSVHFIQDLVCIYEILREEFQDLIQKCKQVRHDLFRATDLGLENEDTMAQANYLMLSLRQNTNLVAVLHFAIMILRAFVYQHETYYNITELRNIENHLNESSEKK